LNGILEFVSVWQHRPVHINYRFLQYYFIVSSVQLNLSTAIQLNTCIVARLSWA